MEPDEAEALKEDQAVSIFNVTNGAMYGRVLYTVGGTDVFCTALLLLLTRFTPSDNMKDCEKVLVYSMLVPDFIAELYLFIFVCPAAIAEEWTYSASFTRWMGFIHTVTVLQPHFATAMVCSVIALSRTDVYRYEGANQMNYMCALAFSTACITICLCSLPATESGGYTVLTNWMSPSFNLDYGHGSKIMVWTMLGIILLLYLKGVFDLKRARSNILRKPSPASKRSLSDLDKEMLFTILSTATLFLVFPAFIIGSSKPGTMFVLRVILYVCPVVRVILLYYICPHFRFGVSSDESADEFVLLGEDDDTFFASTNEGQDIIDDTFTESETSEKEN